MRNALFALLLAAAPLPAQTVPLVERTLPNGLRVLLVERHNQPSIACGWVARAGSANETAGATGMAHLFEHMMFKGTDTIGTRNAARDRELNALQDRVRAGIRQEVDRLRERQRRGGLGSLEDPSARSPRHQELLDEFNRLVAEQRSLVVKDELPKLYDEMGATDLNANTTPDRTFFHITVPANKLELWAWLESDRLKNAVFREFYSERDVVLEERRQRTDGSPAGRIMEAFAALSWEALPYRWPVIGWPSDVTQITREQADAFYATYYAPNNLSLILVGDFRTEEAFALVERYFGRLAANPAGVPPVLTTEPLQVAEQRMVAEADASPMLRVSYKTVSGVHRGAPALQVLAGVLNGASGRLHRALVLHDQAALSVRAGAFGMRYGGTFNVMAEPAPGRGPADLEPVLYRELERIRTGGVTEEELTRVKNQAQVALFRMLENNGGLRYALAEAEGMGTAADLLDAPRRLREVTRDDVMRVARTYLSPENRTVLLLSRKKAPGGPQPVEVK
ncbi:pitrilysin family protein [Geothrix sp. 21YS21S-2]|uniref:M16 family metallopeptidase n=1 Tax=Geothrix sp. 21YS21S-2 TaxID=3068893 RepID=UPI0027BAC093|nr:pitrilysin family protein [Geothrix sp. 21YS21S-2]